MAESTSKVVDSTPEVEQHVSESTPAPAPAIEELKEQGLKTEVLEPQEAGATEEQGASAVDETPASATASIEESPVVLASEDLTVDTAKDPVDKEAVPETVTVADAPVIKADHPSLFQKVKKAFEFPKSHKSKESPTRELEAPLEPGPEAEAAAPVAAESAVETTPPAAATPETKPTAAGKVSEKVSEGKGFFIKVKKSFFTKSHSFSGSIPDSKLDSSPAAPPPAITEVPITTESVPAPAPAPQVTETLAPAAAESAVEATPASAAADVSAASILAHETVAPATETAAPAAEEPKEATPETVDEKAVVKEDKPKNRFFQKIVRRLLPKSSHNTLPSGAPAAAPAVAASA